jgi:hypothetical protein
VLWRFALASSCASLIAVAIGCSLVTPLDDLQSGGGDGAGDAPSGPVQLVTTRVRDIALDDTSVYWVEEIGNRVGVLQKTNPTPTYLIDGTGGFYPLWIALDDANVYWSSTGGIYSCAKAGCGNTPTTLFDATTDASGGPYVALAGVDDLAVYFFAQDAVTNVTTAKKVALGGGPALPIGSTSLCTVNRQKLIDGVVYFTCDDGRVASMNAANGAVKILTSASPPPNANGFVVKGSALFYGQLTQPGAIYSLSTSQVAAPTPVATGQDNATGFAADDTYLYWLTTGPSGSSDPVGTLTRCPIGSCSNPTILASGQDLPISVAVDDTSIYWSAIGASASSLTGIWVMPKSP